MWYAIGMIKTCTICPNEFETTNKNAKYCSRACYGRSKLGKPSPHGLKRVTIVCEGCNKSFEAGGRSGKKATARFCSIQCAQDTASTGTTCAILSDVDAAYIAGLIDGEGTIMLYNHRQQVTLRVSVANTY